MKITAIKNVILGVALIALGTGCKKYTDNLKIPPANAHFASTTTFVSYYVENSATSSFSINVGTTDVADVDRTVGFKITSPSGAVAGTHYTVTSPVSGNTVTIPAGKAIGSVLIHGVFSYYSTGRKDTLVVTLSEPSLTIAKFSDTLKVVLQRYCAVTDVALNGAYANSRDYYPTIAPANASASKYTATVSNFVQTGTSTGTILIKNLGNTADVGFAPFAPTDPAATGLTATLDWTDPANFKVTIPSQNYVASLYTYGQSTISGSGTFSTCDQTLTVSYIVKVSAGSFAATYTTLIR